LDTSEKLQQPKRRRTDIADYVFNASLQTRTEAEYRAERGLKVAIANAEAEGKVVNLASYRGVKARTVA
jgi:hypothetical protein